MCLTRFKYAHEAKFIISRAVSDREREREREYESMRVEMVEVCG